MQPARRLWVVVAVAGLGALLALLTRAPQFVLATAGVGGWLLVAQALAVRAFARVDRSLTVTQTVTPDVAVRDGVVQCRLEATLDAPRSVPVACTATLPPSVRPETDGDATLRAVVPPGETSAVATRECRADTAGTVQFDPPAVTVAGPYGLFGTQHTATAAPTLDVEPTEPRDVRIGRGTAQPVSSFGVYGGGDVGTGLDPAELREYVSGDPRRHIDWNATARRNEPHTREYEPDADAEFRLVFDHSAALGVGPPGQTILAFLRDVALDTVAAAERAGDPLGLVAVDADGVARRRQSTTAPDGYRQIANALAAVEAGGDRTEGGIDTTNRAVSRRTRQRRADRLADADGTFASRLRPLCEPYATVVGQSAETPLRGVVQSLRADATAQTHVLLFTTDQDRAAVYDATELAAQVASRVTVFVAPTVLFATDALADLDDATARYRSFESFRATLEGVGPVRAFEVAPGDRLEALLRARPAATGGGRATGATQSGGDEQPGGAG